MAEFGETPIIRNWVFFIIWKYYAYYIIPNSNSALAKPIMIIGRISGHGHTPKLKRGLGDRLAGQSDYDLIVYGDRGSPPNKYKSSNYLLVSLYTQTFLILPRIFGELHRTIILHPTLLFLHQTGLWQLTKMSMNDPTSSILSSDSQEISEGEHEDENSIQQQALQAGQENQYVKQYSIHQKISETKQFPFHRYTNDFKYQFKSHEYSVLQNYFRGASQSNSTLQKLDPTQVQFLNKMPRKFLKVPKRAIVFLHIKLKPPDQEVFEVKNYRGEIILFDIVSKGKKRKTLISELNRKIMSKRTKTRLFFVILDQSSLNQSIFQMRGMRKLATQIKYFYVKIINQQELQYVRNKFLPHLNQLSSIQIDVDESEKYISLYSFSEGESSDSPASAKQKADLIQNLKKLKQQQSKLMSQVINLQDGDQRLRLLDMMYVNYCISTTKSRQQFISEFITLMRKEQDKLDQYQDAGEYQTSHSLEIMHDAKVCKHCFITDNKKRSKSKYMCLACSLKYGVDIPLCKNCTDKFHALMNKTVNKVHFKDIPHKDWKKAYQDYQAQANQPNKSEINRTILKLNQNWNDISAIMNELMESSPEGVKLAKQFNEAFVRKITEELCSGEPWLPTWKMSGENWTLQLANSNTSVQEQ